MIVYTAPAIRAAPSPEAIVKAAGERGLAPHPEAENVSSARAETLIRAYRNRLADVQARTVARTELARSSNLRWRRAPCPPTSCGNFGPGA